MSAQALLTYLHTHEAAMVESLAALVQHESPSADKAALDALAARLADRFAGLGAAITMIGNASGGDLVRARFDSPAASGQPALILCHFDTVWPLGTLAARPFQVVDGRAYGPGAFDMKASIVLAEYAVRALQATGQSLPRPVDLLLTADEEIGSPASRPQIEELARASAYVLVLEAPLPGGRLKTARKGVGRFVLEVEGRAAHAGVEPERGISAIRELAHQVLALHDLAAPAHGTTINVGVIQGGTTPNVVPAHASASIDVRVSRLDEARRIEQALAALPAVLPGARVSVSGGFNRPPMERTPAVAALFERARTLGQQLGLDLQEGSTGGASDGNFTAALGRPTLDGLGALGAGAHADDEHIVIASLPPRAALLALLLLHL